MRRFLPSLLAVAIVVVFSVFQRELLGDIFQRLRGVHPLEVVPLTLAGIGMIVARGFFLKSCSPGISLRQSITADQSALAAGYGIALGGGAVGTGLRIHMFTRWGMSSQVIGASIVATAVVPSFTTWGLPIVVLTPTAITSSLEDIQFIAMSAGGFVISISVVFWWFALMRPSLFTVVGRIGLRLQNVFLRRVPARFWRSRKLIEKAQPDYFTNELRLSLRSLLKSRGHLILLASLSTLLAGFTCLLVSAHVFGTQGLTVYEALIAFSLVRVLIALSPIPGAAGIAELGLIALLERAGVSLLDATGTTLLYRFLTWFVPIVVGTGLWWRYSHRRQEASHGQIHNNNQQLEDTGRGVSVHG
jgi:uncharacterized membrane protein YbhN (UPF0104 family)